MDDHEAAAALRIGVDEFAFGGLEVATNLAVDDEHIGLGELGRRREDVAALGEGTLGIEQGNPVPEEGRVVMITGPVGLWTRADKDTEGLRARAGSWDGVGSTRPRGGVGGEKAKSGQEGEEEAQHGRGGELETNQGLEPVEPAPPRLGPRGHRPG